MYAAMQAGCRTHYGGKQEMMAQERHVGHLNVVAHLMDLAAGMIVDVDILLLCDSKEGFMVQPAGRYC